MYYFPILPLLYSSDASIFSIILSLFLYIAGIVLCLVFNVIAVTVCWIRGGGKLCFLSNDFATKTSLAPWVF